MEQPTSIPIDVRAMITLHDPTAELTPGERCAEIVLLLDALQTHFQALRSRGQWEGHWPRIDRAFGALDRWHKALARQWTTRRFTCLLCGHVYGRPLLTTPCCEVPTEQERQHAPREGRSPLEDADA